MKIYIFDQFQLVDYNELLRKLCLVELIRHRQSIIRENTILQAVIQRKAVVFVSLEALDIGQVSSILNGAPANVTYYNYATQSLVNNLELSGSTLDYIQNLDRSILKLAE